MQAPQVTLELKNDVMGLVERVDGPAGPVVRRVARGGRIPGTGVVARVLLRRERRALERLEGVFGVARLVKDAAYAAAPSRDGRVPRQSHVLMRSWVDGVPLQQASELPENFFDLVLGLVQRLHAHGVCHNDLHKEANILVGEDGYPALVDFQLASIHGRDDRKFRVRVMEDIRHVEKHRYKYLSRGGSRRATDVGPPARKRRSLIAHLWLRLGKPPYMFVSRRLLGYAGGERGRPKSGPWPDWTAPLAPR
jgi:predicted Ser/Thr protein kinase